MAELVRMPKMSDTMTEGTLTKWLKKVGDEVKEGDILAEVETDKAVMELESYENGFLLHQGAEEGVAVEVDKVIAIIGDKKEDIKALLANGAASGEAAASPEAAPPTQTTTPPAPKPTPPTPTSTPETPSSENGQTTKSSPLARRMAKEKGIALQQVRGTGPQGRIIKRDIEQFLTSPQTPSLQEEYEDLPLSQMRKIIAQRLSESKFTAPHFYLSIQVRMDELLRARKNLNETSKTKISINDWLIKATSLALKQHPQVNASWHETHLRLHKAIHIGVAVAVPDGLVVPVLKHTNQLCLSDIATQVKTFAQQAKDRKLPPETTQGSTFSISNLGMFGISNFTAVINPPNAAILAVGGIEQSFVPNKKNKPELASLMKITLSCDHRVVDGAIGAAFLKDLKNYLEQPVSMLL